MGTPISLSNLSADSGLWFAKMLAILGTQGDQPLLDTYVSEVTELPVRSLRFSTGQLYAAPQVYAASSGGDTLILVGPTPGLAYAASSVAGWTINTGTGLFNNINGTYDTTAAAIIAFLRAQNVPLGGQITCVGFSAGGAIAQCIARRFIAANQSPTPSVQTFGSPRTFGRNFVRQLATGTVFRWMNDNDVVPIIPPRLSDIPTGIAVSYAVSFLDAVYWLHTAGGVQLDVNGVPTVQETPSRATWGGNIDFATWLYQYETGSPTAHNITEYVRRLTLLVNALPARQEPPPRRAPTEPFNPPDRAALSQAERANVDTIFRRASQQLVLPVEIPPVQAFRAIRQGPIWVVMFGDTTVAIGPAKRRARAMARTGNDFLRHMQVQGIVDPNAIVQQFQAYMEVSASGQGGFQPPLNVTWPTS